MKNVREFGIGKLRYQSRHPSINKPGKFFCSDHWYYVLCHSMWCWCSFVAFLFACRPFVCLFASFLAMKFTGFSDLSPTKHTGEVLPVQNVKICNRRWFLTFRFRSGVTISSCSPLNLRKLIWQWPTWSLLESFTGYHWPKTRRDKHEHWRVAHHLKVAAFLRGVMYMLVVK